MSDKQTQAQLTQEAWEIEEQLSKLDEGKELGEARDLENTPEDDAQEAEVGGRIKALKEALSVRLRNIRLSLHKLRDKSYGVCDRCGGEISVERLQAVPEARYCLECAGEMEG